MTTASDLVQDISGLITLPDIYLRINRQIDNPESSTTDIANAIKQDAAFTARLLKVANSPLYHFPSSIDTVDKAVTIIGTSQVRNLALSMSVASSFAGLPNELVSMANFWRHSLLCGLCARHLAQSARRGDPDALFTAGLLHDIGELILFNRLPEQAKAALNMVLDSSDEIPVYLAEREVMGFDHSDVGGELARNWQLPPLLTECIAHHHKLAEAKQFPREAAVIHLANILAQLAEIDSLDLADVEAIDPLAWQLTGLTEAVIEPVVRATQAEVSDIEKMFTGQA